MMPVEERNSAHQSNPAEGRRQQSAYSHRAKFQLYHELV